MRYALRTALSMGCFESVLLFCWRRVFLVGARKLIKHQQLFSKEQTGFCIRYRQMRYTDSNEELCAFKLKSQESQEVFLSKTT